jgi:DNA-binding NtrC family response regulator
MARIMLVDDEENILKAIRRALSVGVDDDSADGHYIEIFTSATQALIRASEGVAFDIVISDYRMPEMDGVSFFKKLRDIQPDTVRFIVSGQTDLDGLVAAINEARIHRFISKPWDDHALRLDIQQAVELQMLQSENKRLANLVRLQQGLISEQDIELQRLEAETPGITKVSRTSDGSVLLDD